jgi:antitoxin (DNA-binding transcriptional repressor) of toxin-antitoxin stability system
MVIRGHQMVKVAVSEFKAKLASYLRLIKTGEQVEIQDRGIAVAVLASLPSDDQVLVIPPSKDPKLLAQMKAKVTIGDGDAVQILLDDRAKR